MKLPNPSKQEFERVSQDSNGEDEYGFRTVEGQEEIVHIPSGKSNMSYYKPEVVMSTAGCKHVFQVVDMGKREFVCKCGWGVTVRVDQILEDKKGMHLRLHGGIFPVSIL